MISSTGSISSSEFIDPTKTIDLFFDALSSGSESDDLESFSEFIDSTLTTDS